MNTVVMVEWLDITASEYKTMLTRWHSTGFLLHRNKMVKGIPCVVIAQSWTGSKYTERLTIPEAVVVSVKEV